LEPVHPRTHRQCREGRRKRLALFANSRAGGDVTVNAMLATKQTNPDLIVAGAPKIGFIFGSDLPTKYPSSTLAEINNGTYSFIGEILYTHGDKPDHPPTPRWGGYRRSPWRCRAVIGRNGVGRREKPALRSALPPPRGGRKPDNSCAT
jgi:hypothetical protein